MSAARQVVPSLTRNKGLTSRGKAVSAPPTGDNKKLFSEVVCGKMKNGTN